MARTLSRSVTSAATATRAPVARELLGTASERARRARRSRPPPRPPRAPARTPAEPAVAARDDGHPAVEPEGVEHAARHGLSSRSQTQHSCQIRPSAGLVRATQGKDARAQTDHKCVSSNLDLSAFQVSTRSVAPAPAPTQPRRPWIEHWIDTVRDLSSLKATHPMMDAVIDEVDGRDDPHRRSLARRLRVVQLPRVRPRPRDHRRGPGLPRRVGHAPQLVAPARQPAPVRGDRGAAHRARSARGRPRAADHHPHPHVGDPGARRRRARSSSTAARTRRSTTAARSPASHGAAVQPLPLRGPRPPRRAPARRARSQRA